MAQQSLYKIYFFTKNKKGFTTKSMSAVVRADSLENAIKKGKEHVKMYGLRGKLYFNDVYIRNEETKQLEKIDPNTQTQNQQS